MRMTFTRLTFDRAGALTNSDHLVGLLVATSSIIAFAEVAGSMRLINIAFGAWLIAAPWLLDGVISGALIPLALPCGPIKDVYAGWDRYIV